MADIIFRIYLVLGILLLPFSTNATNYYVSKEGNDSNSGTSAEQAWLTIGKANAALQPGDIVFIAPGTYAESIRPATSGSPGNYITYTCHQEDTVVIQAIGHGADLSNRSYIIIDGIRIMNVGGNWVCFDPSGQHNIIQNCYMEEAGAYEGLSMENGADYNKILGNTLIGYCGPDDLIQIMNSGHNLIEGNKMYYGAHDAFDIQDRIDGTTSYNIIRHNYIQNKWHGNFDIWGVENILIENNVVFDGGVDRQGNLCGSERDRTSARIDNKGIMTNARFSIIRRNISVNNGTGIVMVGSVDDWKQGCHSNRYYHNVLSENVVGISYEEAIPITQNVLKNNIVYDNVSAEIAITDVEGSENYFVNNNIFGGSAEYASGDIPIYTISFDPLFVDAANRNFHLRSDSPMIDAGEWLTRTASAGSGNKIPVEDAHYFMDGWGLIEGDSIQFEGQSQIVQIPSVDYENNLLTVDQSLIWTAGLGVSMPYNGSRPDIGAYEELWSGLSDSEAPSVPLNLTAKAILSSAIKLNWNASTDNIGVTCYNIYREGAQDPIASSVDTFYTDRGLVENTSYTYSVTAFDLAHNESAHSGETEVKTQSANVLETIEAESGLLESPMRSVQNTGASGGAYISSTVRDQGTATYEINISDDGMYKITAQVYAADGSSNSFFVTVDQGNRIVWSTATNAVWHEEDVTASGNAYSVELTAGTHTLVIQGREIGTRLDYFYLTKIGELATGIFTGPLLINPSVDGLTSYPNPFSQNTTIAFHLAKRSPVRIDVFNIAGQQVRTLVNDIRNAGEFQVSWNAQNDAGQPVSQGVYIYRMTAGTTSQSRKVMLK